MDPSVFSKNLEIENSLREEAALWAADRSALKQKCLELEEKQKRRK